MCSRSGCAGAVVSTSGVYRASRGVGRSTPRVEKIQKRRFHCQYPPHLHKSKPI
nr:MAG TPA: hypothetical protein [Caudoviricetes sp.]